MDEKSGSYRKFIAWFLAIIVAGVAIFMAAFWFSGNKTGTVLPQPKPDEIVITTLPNGKQLVENRTWRYKVRVLGNWQVNRGSANYSLKAVEIGAKNSFEIYFYDNPENFSLENWLRKNRNIKDFSIVNVASTTALSYSTPVYLSDDPNSQLENSEIYTVVFRHLNKIVELSCTSIGTSYKKEIDDCRISMNSFNF